MSFPLGTDPFHVVPCILSNAITSKQKTVKKFVEYRIVAFTALFLLRIVTISYWYKAYPIKHIPVPGWYDGVIQEFAVEAVELAISNNRAEGFGGLFVSKVLTCMASKCPENALKWTAKLTILAVRYPFRYLVRHLFRYQMLS